MAEDSNGWKNLILAQNIRWNRSISVCHATQAEMIMSQVKGEAFENIACIESLEQFSLSCCVSPLKCY